MTILAIRNRKGKPELVVSLKRDVNGIIPMPEDIELLPLYLNPVLEPLVLCLAHGLFHDFKTADEVFALEPSPDEGCYELAFCEPTTSLFRPFIVQAVPPLDIGVAAGWGNREGSEGNTAL
ncbi:hypothetical protein FQN55_006241 [Onygenales sp. PD_40]|nr:hypothetical protein FQN55_006241 [Onygenales sp. PD_40]